MAVRHKTPRVSFVTAFAGAIWSVNTTGMASRKGRGGGMASVPFLLSHPVSISSTTARGGPAMTTRILGPLVLVVLAQGVPACSGAGVSPTPLATAANPVSQQTPIAPCNSPETSFYGCAYTRMGVSLTGMVYEVTEAGPVGIAGADIYCEACGLMTHTWATTDANGVYSFSGDLASGGGV